MVTVDSERYWNKQLSSVCFMLSHFYPALMLCATVLSPGGHVSSISAPKEFNDHVLGLKK